MKDALSPGGLVLKNEKVEWLNSPPLALSATISAYKYSVTLKAPAGSTGFSKTVVIRYSKTITNDQYKDLFTDIVYHQGWLEDKTNQRTSRIDLKSVTAATGNTGGKGPASKPVRTASSEIQASQLGLLDSPDLPGSGSGGYRLFLVNSSDGANYTFTAANNTGYGLFAASSPNLVDDANGDDSLDPSTSLAAVYPGGSPYAGAYAGTNKDLVLRDGSGQTYLLTACGYTGVPNGLMTIPDGQSETASGDTDIPDGSDALWLFFETPTGTVTFLVTPNTPLDPPSPPPSISITDTSGSEDDSGTTDADVTVTLSDPQTEPVTVDYTTTPGTAASPSDFADASGTLTFQPGETTKTITVAISGDTTFEPNEDFFVNLGAATNAVIADGVGTATIQDDDAQPTVSINDVTQNEGNSGTTSFVFTVTLSNPSWQTITVDFATADDSATAGSDYAAASGTITFLPGETTKTITITVYGDTTPEAQLAQYPNPPGEGFFVNLSAPTNAGLVDAQGLGWISNDDSGL